MQSGGRHKVWGKVPNKSIGQIGGVLLCQDSSSNKETSSSVSDSKTPSTSSQHEEKGRTASAPASASVRKELASESNRTSRQAKATAQAASEPADASVLPSELSGGSVSMGSALHAQGQCKPCLRINMKWGCLKGKDCEFCHLDHPSRRGKTRPCKAKRTESKRLAALQAERALAESADQSKESANDGTHERDRAESSVRSSFPYKLSL